MPRRWLAACSLGLAFAASAPTASAQQMKLLETVTIPAPPSVGHTFGRAVTNTVFKAGSTYRVVISGVLTAHYDDGTSGQWDTAYCFAASPPNESCAHDRVLPSPYFSGPGDDAVNRFFWHLDMPGGIEDAPAYNSTHTYESTFTASATGRVIADSTHILTTAWTGSFTLEIYGPPPSRGTCRAAIPRTQRVLANRGVKFTVSCPVEATVVGAVRLAGKAVGHATGAAPADGAIALKVKLKRATRELIRSRLRAGRRVVLRLTVAAIDVNTGATVGVVMVKVRVE